MFNGFLFNVGKHKNSDIPGSLNDSEDRGFFLFKSSSAWRTHEGSAPQYSAFLTNFFRMSFMPYNYVDFVAPYYPFHITPGYLAVVSLKSKIDILWATSGSRSSSGALWLLDWFNPMRYNMTIHTLIEWCFFARKVPVKSLKRKPQLLHL